MRPFVALPLALVAMACSPVLQEPNDARYVPLTVQDEGPETGGGAAAWYGYTLYEGRGDMMGGIGAITGIDAPLRVANVWTLGDIVELEVDQAVTGWALLAGGFDRSLLGETGSVTLEEGEHWVIGCSGQTEDTMDFDSPADTVTVVEGFGRMGTELEVTATFHDGAEVTVVVAYDGE